MTWDPSKPLRVLLIDDNEDDGELLRRYSKKLSTLIEFRQCPCEHECLLLIETERYDIIFLDNRLRVKSGLDVLTDLRNSGYNGPVVHYTTLLDERIIDDLKQLGCSVVLEKHLVTVDSLKSAIESALA